MSEQESIAAEPESTEPPAPLEPSAPTESDAEESTHASDLSEVAVEAVIIDAIAGEESTSENSTPGLDSSAETPARVPEAIVPETTDEIHASLEPEGVQASEEHPQPEQAVEATTDDPAEVLPTHDSAAPDVVEPPVKGQSIEYVMDQSAIAGEVRPGEIIHLLEDGRVDLIVFTEGRLIPREPPTLVRRNVARGTGIEPGTWHPVAAR